MNAPCSISPDATSHCHCKLAIMVMYRMLYQAHMQCQMLQGCVDAEHPLPDGSQTYSRLLSCCNVDGKHWAHIVATPWLLLMYSGDQHVLMRTPMSRNGTSSQTLPMDVPRDEH